MSAIATPCPRILFVDQVGVVVEVEVEPNVAREMRTFDKHARNGEKKRRNHERACTDLEVRDREGAHELDPREFTEDDARRHARARTPAKPLHDWEGPRFEFSLFLGDSEIWQGPEQADFCRGRKLAKHEYCLACNRSGRDNVIPRPSAADLRLRRTAYRPSSKLKGGKES